MSKWEKLILAGQYTKAQEDLIKEKQKILEKTIICGEPMVFTYDDHINGSVIGWSAILPEKQEELLW